MHCHISTSTSYDVQYTGTASSDNYECSNCTRHNCPYSNEISVSNDYRERENFDFFKQLAAYKKKQEQRRTLKNWWMDSFITNHKLYNVPQISRVRFYKILRCNRRGLGLRIKGGR